MGNYSYKNPLNVNVNIFYLNDVSDTVNINSLDSFLNDINNNFKKYHPNLLNGLMINIWNEGRNDMPSSTKVCDPATNVCTITDMQIKQYAGLTWSWNKRTDLNATYCKTDFDLSNLLSHEIGHFIDYWTELDNKQDLIFQEWMRIRGQFAPQEMGITELMAEDIRLLHGSRLAKGYERGNYFQANKVKGLHDMLLVWKPASDFIKSQQNVGATVTVEHKYSNTDLNYYAVQIKVESYFWYQKYTEYYWYDRNAVYKWIYRDNIWKWVVVKLF